MVRNSFFAAAFAVLFTCATACAQNPAPPASSGTNNAPAAATAKPPAPALAVTTGNAASAAPAGTPAQKITYTDVNVDGPYIAMTFDDGPHATNTPKLLDLLAKKHIKATFFLVGQCAAEYPQLVKREMAEGHEVANHSWSHPVLAKMSEEGVRNELQKTDDAITHATGSRPKIMRPPYGELTQKQRQWVHNEFGYRVILWDVDPLDWKDRNAATVARRIIASARPGSIILSHDIHATTIAAMPEVFDALLAKGYKFVTVSELLAMDKGGSRRPAETKKEAQETKASAAGEDAAKKTTSPAPQTSDRTNTNASAATPPASSPAASAAAAPSAPR